MILPAKMSALTLLHEGYANTATGVALDSLEPYLAHATVPTPKPGEGQVVIKVAMASINPSDVYFIKGEYGQPRVKGAPAGFEGVGVVAAAGEGVYAASLLGKRVAFVATHSGAWAEYALTDASACIPVRPDLRDEDAAGQIVNPLTAMAMFDLVRKSGSKSFIFTAGASQLGKLIIGLGRDHKIAPIVTVRRKEQIAPLKELGAAHVLNVKARDFAKQLKTAIEAEKPRILLDAVGDQTAADIFFAMPRGARWVSYGKLATEAPRLTEMGQFIFMDKRIEGFWLTKWMRETPMEDRMKVIQTSQARFVDGKWRTDVSAILPLARAIEEMPAALANSDGKVMITP